ncbi:hypothetical protein BC936DRAFT_147836 [Jimgerdemannia flammicorona]|uniref:Queuine tRNA-ribosyltransferase catalytic subunit 1 n=1 Tax=Jimgerdemannia flammicorona TaxID=994334 RepID=A0A433D4F1_9FUNG|nr:hypothetical protein BC936DRAFT_147836 [Jimgerdemannia flammicorona]
MDTAHNLIIPDDVDPDDGYQFATTTFSATASSRPAPPARDQQIPLPYSTQAFRSTHLMSTNAYLIDQVDPDDGYQFATTTFPENASTRLAPRDFLTDSRDPHVIGRYPPAQQSGVSQVECPECTFYNYPELRECEMCGTSIGQINAVGNDGDAITRVIQLEEYDGLKQGLRHGQYQEQRALWSDMGGFLCETKDGNTPAGLGRDAFLYETRAGPAAYGNRAARAGDGLGKNRDADVWEESEGVNSREEISFDERHQDEHMALTLQKTMDDEAAGPSSSASISAIVSTHDSDWEFARALQSMLDEEDRRLQEEAERDAELARNLQDEEDRGGIDGDDDENDDRMREGADDDDEFDEDDDDAWEDDDDDFSVGVEDAAIEILDETGRGLRQQEQDVRERPPEPEDKMCGICLEERGKLDYGPPTCSHAFCAACWSTYLSTVLRDKRFPCRCAALRCRAVVTPADAERLWSVHNAQDQQGDGRWREEVKEFRRLHEEATMDDSELSGLFVYLFFGSRQVVLPLRFNPETARTPRLHCPGLDPASSTGHDICGRCLVPWHRGLTCEAFRELESQRAEAKNDDEHRTLSLIRKQKWQRVKKIFATGVADLTTHVLCAGANRKGVDLHLFPSMATLTHTLSQTMKSALTFETIAKCSTTKARVTALTLPHGLVNTPVFMPVGTQGSLKGLTPKQLEDMGCKIMLNNTYHLVFRQDFKRPATCEYIFISNLQIDGQELLDEVGGSHRFQNWSGNLLTDSGGFQMVSLLKLAEITEQGVQFASPHDGSMMLLTPEHSMSLQNSIGADIIMQLDDVVSSLTTGPRVEEAMWRSIRWLDRCIAAHKRPETQNLFAIIQGGLDHELRKTCIKEMAKRDTPGYAIGGLSGGEEKDQFWRVVTLCTDLLPRHKPIYCMGVGYAEDLVVCTALGVDMFDCVFPTRTARFGNALTRKGTLSLKSGKFAADFNPIEEGCDCSICRQYTRAYIHMLATRETVGAHLITLHNVAYQLRLMRDMLEAIAADRFPAFVKGFFNDYFKTKGEKYPEWAVNALRSVGIELD